ncbi:MAG: hypothetical protein H8E61_07760 [Bacteroidetes bacterium]|nr:hypothetical protein [Bacteroidota bacterium]
MHIFADPMSKKKKISAFILIIPVLSIIFHNLIPHHHHEACISESHETGCDFIAVEHHHESDIQDVCEYCNLLASNRHQHNNKDCQLSDVFKIQKSNFTLGINPSFSIYYPTNGRICFNKPDIEQSISTSSLLLIYLRGPPVV